MNPATVDIKDVLERESAGFDTPFVFGKNMFIGKEPETPIECLTLYDSGGTEQNAKLPHDEVFVQTRYRTDDYLSGYDMLHEVRKLLEGRASFIENGTRYVGIWVSSNIAFMGRDENDRANWTLNFRIFRHPPETEFGNRHS